MQVQTESEVGGLDIHSFKNKQQAGQSSGEETTGKEQSLLDQIDSTQLEALEERPRVGGDKQRQPKSHGKRRQALVKAVQVTFPILSSILERMACGNHLAKLLRHFSNEISTGFKIPPVGIHCRALQQGLYGTCNLSDISGHIKFFHKRPHN